jgi:hypothetical protein
MLLFFFEILRSYLIKHFFDHFLFIDFLFTNFFPVLLFGKLFMD